MRARLSISLRIEPADEPSRLVMPRRAAATSAERIMRLTGPTPPAGADRRVNPRTIRAKASSGRPASSPQIDTGVPVSAQAFWID